MIYGTKSQDKRIYKFGAAGTESQPGEGNLAHGSFPIPSPPHSWGLNLEAQPWPSESPFGCGITYLICQLPPFVKRESFWNLFWNLLPRFGGAAERRAGQLANSFR